jgi:hypothetical protein
MKKFFSVVAAVLIIATTHAQQKDTVIINLAKTSKIIFTVEDPKDLDILKHYDFQLLFEDILKGLEEKKKSISQNNDSTEVATTEELPSDEDTVNEEGEEDIKRDREDEENHERENDVYHRDDGHYEDEENNDDNDHDSNGDKRGRWHRTWQAFNFDLGTNNYLMDKKFPADNQAYAVRPWGSWYLGLASVQRSRITKKFFLEWGMGLSWYTFKFQDDNTIITIHDDGVNFSLDERDLDFKKSKLSISYIQASLIPVLDFGDHGRKPRFWDGYNDNAFRIGFGPYIGYRISSHSKIVYNDDGRERDKDRDGFYLNNFRYGARLQLGYRSTDLFFNYDLNELFQENRGPKLNAFSFGVIF